MVERLFGFGGVVLFLQQPTVVEPHRIFAVGAVIFQPLTVQLQSFMGLASMVQLLSFGDQFLW